MPRGPLDPLKPGHCEAICEDFDRPAYHASMQRIVQPSEKRCTRKGKEKVGHLSLCAAHAKLCRQGFMAEDGRVTASYMRRDYAKYPDKFKSPHHKWLPGADPRSA